MLKMNHLPFLQVKPKILVTAGCVILALSTTVGCDNNAVQDRNRAAEMTTELSASLDQIAGSAVFPLSASRRAELRSDYENFLNKVGSIPAAALQEQKDNLNALDAEARLALAKISLEEANSAEQAVHARLSLVIQSLGASLELNSMASAAAEVDYSSLKAEIDQKAQLSRTRQNALKGEAQQLQKQISDLEEKIASELASYDKMSNDAATRREKSFSAPLEQQRAILSEAAAMSRQADGHSVRAANLEAALDLLQPELQTVQTRIAQTETELISFDSSRAALVAREKVATDNVGARRQDLSAMNSTIANSLTDIYAAKDQVQAAYDAAISDAEAALAKASSARRSPGGETRIIQAEQAVGTAHWRKAQFLQRVSDVAEQMAQQKGIIGRGDNDRVAFDAIQPDLAAAIQAAGAAFTSAAENADNLNVQSESEETRLRLLADLNETVKTITGAVAVEAAVMDEDEFDEDLNAGNFDDNTNESAGPASGDPRDTLRLLANVEDLDGAIGVVTILHPATDVEQQALVIAEEVMIEFKGLESACRTAFGAELFADWGTNSLFAAFSLSADDLKFQKENMNADIDEAEFQYEENGTVAYVIGGGEFDGERLVQIDGTWKAELDFENDEAFAGINDAKITRIRGVADSLVAAVSDTISSVESSGFADLDAVEAHLDEVLTPIFFKFLGIMGSGTGTPGG